MALTERQRELFRSYSSTHQSIFSERIIQEFFNKDQNIELLLKSLEGDSESQEQLEIRFRKHFFQIRFIKFLSTTINYCTLGQMRSNQKNDSRNPLIFDQPVGGEEGNGILGELLLTSGTKPDSEPIYHNPSQFLEAISNEGLENAFVSLSSKQQLIITLSYALGYKDKEIAKMIAVTPQAVSKVRNLALKKLRSAIQEGA
ncbi:hypothetical protein A8L34_27030 [Bacillus sp. FJAT-27264]|uniref:sigma factor-like helix-turn-helix DNA-binding protein n=1 Tax=Paenibacillus sp. (strain DSM 101736 / FJAT-27264) TaxID=1850362 RepID=UPI000807D53F|nr:sigma factor-like helix-turn-helix DNA-binding protein [Bacillus sp. FJAT-27264]OBZ16335.1 hypothetical protein A8L34_27030 [Bacillus sp. FJAT-27264]